MITRNIFISPDKKEEIKRVSDTNLLDVIGDYIQLKNDGQAGLKGDCHHCGKTDGLKYSKRKKLFKCWSCNTGGSTALSYLVKFEGIEFREALFVLADRFNINLEEEENHTPKKKRNLGAIAKPFRDQQLIESGIPFSAQKYFIKKGSAEVESDRFQAGTLNQYGEISTVGDDMLLHYIDLDNRPILYKTKHGKEKALVRIRYQNPAQHPDKDGKPAKYRSPSGSGSHLWIPQRIITDFNNGRKYSTLVVCEGEKKATKLAHHGVCAVGIMGIHNFAYNKQMPHQFELLITKFGIQNTVFLLDTDFQDLSLSSDKPVDSRPKAFFKAVKKYKDYFYAFNLQDIGLDIYFGHHISDRSKGIDDFLMDEFKGQEDNIGEKLQNAIIHREHHNDVFHLYDITSESEYKIKEIWNLHSGPAFIEKHKESLRELREFTLAGLKRRVNEDGEIELAQKIQKHEQYWQEDSYGKNDEKIRIFFDHWQIKTFLQNRGFGLYKITEDNFRMIQIDGKIVKEINPHYIQHYVTNFTMELDEPNKLDILRMLARGSTQYLGPDKLSGMFFLEPNFYEPEKDSQYLFFKHSFVKISADSIDIRPLNELPYNIWKNKQIDFEPTVLEPMMKLDRKGENWEFTGFESMDKSDIAQFLYFTSLTYWKKLYKLQQGPDGKARYVERAEKEIDQPSLEEIHESDAHMAAKLLSIGYMIHEYSDLSNRKAIIAMDMEETEVGQSQGGTGKSIFSIMFEHLVPTYIIDGKTPRMVDDPHLYEGVDERTRCIVFDDCRVNFDFEFLFSQITRGLTVNPKGKTKYTISPPPKFILNTNHAFNGEGNSFERRQYLIAFSDFFNEHRTPYDLFGRILFQDWDYDQWNYFYNLIFQSIQYYLKYGLRYKIPRENIRKRQLRQKIGENFLEFAQNRWDPSGNWLNHEVEKKFAYEQYINDYPLDRKYVNIRRFKEKVKQFAEYSKLHYNPHKDGGIIKSNSEEYICVADNRFDAQECQKISNNPTMF